MIFRVLIKVVRVLVALDNNSVISEIITCC